MNGPASYPPLFPVPFPPEARYEASQADELAVAAFLARLGGLSAAVLEGAFPVEELSAGSLAADVAEMPVNRAARVAYDRLSLFLSDVEALRRELVGERPGPTENRPAPSPVPLCGALLLSTGPSCDLPWDHAGRHRALARAAGATYWPANSPRCDSVGPGFRLCRLAQAHEGHHQAGMVTWIAAGGGR